MREIQRNQARDVTRKRRRAGFARWEASHAYGAHHIHESLSKGYSDSSIPDLTHAIDVDKELVCDFSAGEKKAIIPSATR
jgi:hypothetical protein